MNVWGITDRGVVREQNQDSFAHKVLEDGRILAVVCDGMGGARAGNVASTMAVEAFLEAFLHPEEGLEDRERLEQAAVQANRAVYRRANSDEGCAGMGTTLVAVLAGEQAAVLLNEGDSRAYHIAQGQIRRITRDHSLVEDLVQRGELTREEARVHPHRNLITRALGSEPELRADYFRQPLEPGDLLLLCSDGLSNMLTDRELLEETARNDGLEACCQRLLQRALERGAPDNVTAVLIQR